MTSQWSEMLHDISALRVQAAAEAVRAARIVAESVQPGTGAVPGDAVGSGRNVFAAGK